jgi:hypothetical protein
MAKNPHKPFNLVTTEDGEQILEAKPMHDSTMVVRKAVPTAPTVPVIVEKSNDLVAPEPVNKKKLDLK